LRKAEERLYSEGLIIASDNIDEVILIKSSKKFEEARGN
jgi:DNA gyrase/topoisomerase IV subunit A